MGWSLRRSKKVPENWGIRSAGRAKFLINGAVSMDRCNTCLEFTGRSFKAQSFSWTLIEAQRYLVEIGLRITGQVGFLGQVLSQQPAGVFVGASLPGALRIT